MKYLCIIFATVIPLAILPLLDTIAAQVKGYENLDEFLTDVKTTSGDTLNFVTKIQALFCPNQPVCGADVELERKDVLDTLPAVISVANVTVNVEDIADSVDVCCMPCSCADSCRQADNCCPTKQMLTDTSNYTSVVNQECIAASVVSYKDKLALDSSHTFLMFPMVTSCFLDNSNLTLVAECQQPDTDALSDNIPVTSMETGYTYWNRPCAVCNDDSDDIVEWTPNVFIKTNMPYFANSSYRMKIPYPDTYELLSSLLNSRRLSDFIYNPPGSIMPDKCMKKEMVPAPDCKQVPEEIESVTLDWLLESCRQIFNPVNYGLRSLFYNLFCLLCSTSLQFIESKPICRSDEPMKAAPGSLTSLFNYKLEPDQPATPDDDRPAEEECGCAEILDPYLHVCKTQYCTSGQIRIGCNCIEPFLQTTGMPVALVIKVTSRQERSDSASLTTGQLRKLHTALKRALEAIAVNTTAEIAKTLQQENASSLTYLSMVIAYSDSGMDTKLAMKPFLSYLDTDEVLELSVGKLDFLATLTTNARLWAEPVRGSNVYNIKACCLDQKPDRLVEVYTNKGVTEIGEIKMGVYQPMSRLLYCKQLELGPSEHFIDDSGIVQINVTEPMFAISDYYPVSQSRVRVCTDMYVPKGKERKSVATFCTSSVELIMLSLMSVVVTCMMN